MANITQNPFGRMSEPRANFESAALNVRGAGQIGQAARGLALTAQSAGVLFARERLQSEMNSLETRALKDLMKFEQGLQSDPDYGSHEQKLDDFLEGKQSQYQREFDARAWSQFEPRLREINMRARTNVQQTARRKQIDQSKATMTLELRDIADMYASADETTRRELVGLAADVIGSRRENGFLTAQEAVTEALDFQDTLAITDIRNDLMTDPEDVERRLLAGDYALSEEDRAVWLSRATAQAEAATAKRVRLNDRADRDREEERERTEKTTAKEALRLQAQGQLTLDWILSNETNLSVANYKQLLAGVREPAEDDMAIVIALHDRIDDGIDVSQQISDGMFNGTLTRATADSIRARNDRMFGRERPSTPYKRGSAFLRDAMKPSDLNPNPAGQEAYANAVVEFEAWFDKNPDASATESVEQAKRVADSYRIVPATIYSVSWPEWMKGSRMKPDFDSTAAQIRVDFESGKIDADEGDRRARKLKEMRDLFSGSPLTGAGGGQ